MSLGGGSSRAPQPVQQTTNFTPSPQQQELLSLALPFAKTYANSPMETYTGPTLAGFNQNDTASQQGYLNAIPGLQAMAGQGAAAQKFLLDPAQLDPNSNPWIQKVGQQLTGDITARLNQDVLPNIRAGSIQANGMFAGGSTRGQMAERLAGTDAVGQMGDALNNLYFNNYRLGTENMQRAVAQNPQVMASQLFPADVQGAVGGQQRNMQQAEYDNMARAWALEQQLPFLRAKDIMSLAAGIPGGTTTSSVVGSMPQTNPLMSLLGGGIGGGSLASMMFPSMAAAGPAGAGLGALAALLMR